MNLSVFKLVNFLYKTSGNTSISEETGMEVEGGQREDDDGEAYLQCESGSVVVGGQLQQHAGVGASQPDSQLRLHHPRLRSEGQRHFQVRGDPKTNGNSGSSTKWSCPP